MRYSNFTKEDEVKFLELMNEGTVAAFIYSPNVCANGKLIRYDENNRFVRTIAISGVILVPVSLFSSFLGCEFKQDGEEFSISCPTGAISGTASKKENSQGAFKVAPMIREGGLYVPVIETARALGIAAKSFYQDRLVIVGSREKIELITENEALYNAGSYVIFGEYDISNVPPSEYKKCKAKWRASLVGTEQINDISNPVIKQKIENINAKCKASYESMNKEGDPIILWGDYVPTESNELWDQYKKILDLAKGWGTYNSDYYHDPEILEKIIFGMEWGYRHLYGEDIINGCGWRDPHLFNWWYWYVGAPEMMTDILFIIEDEVSREDIKRYFKCFEWIATWMCTTDASTLTRICVCTKVALLYEEPKWLLKEYEDYDKLLVLNDKKPAGPRIDYVDFTHHFPYNNAYGKLNLDRVLLVASMLAGTELAFTNPQAYNQFGMCKYMFEAAMYRARAFIMFMGRSTHANETSSGCAIISDMLPMIGVYGDDEDRYIKHYIKRSTISPEATHSVRMNCNFYNLALYESILADDTISAEDDYEYAHAWFTGDRAAQHRNNYAFGIAMSSKREFTYESINSANKMGWYTGDGATYLYTTYDKNAYSDNNFVNVNEDIAYRVAGTTEDSRLRVKRSISSTYQWYPSKSFAGAISIDDKFIVACMDFEGYHYEGEDIKPNDDGYGGSLVPHKNDLEAKKAWFCFDNEILCLGAGIKSTMNSEVKTTIEHIRLVNEEENRLSVRLGEEIKTLPVANYRYFSGDAKWALLDNHAGYVFLDNNERYIARYISNDKFSQPCFELGVTHGANPKSGEYAYVIIPYATKETLDAFVEAPGVEILQNTEKLQAARDTALGMSGYVFYEAGKIDGIRAENPCEIAAMRKDGEYKLRITEPTHELSEVVIILDGEYEVISHSDKLKVSVENGSTRLTLNTTDAIGRPFEAVFKI